MARGRPAGEALLMETTADARQRPVVLDTGALSPAVRRRGRLARVVLGAAVAALLSAGAIAAGSWSIVTAARGDAAAEQPAPLWYPTPPPVRAVEADPAPHTKPVIRPTPAGRTTSVTPRSTYTASIRKTSGRGSSGGGADDPAGDDHGGGGNSGKGGGGNGGKGGSDD
jgi:uncharacterized membrane protein YgcG